MGKLYNLAVGVPNHHKEIPMKKLWMSVVLVSLDVIKIQAEQPAPPAVSTAPAIKTTPAASEASSSKDLQIEKLMVGTGVENRELVGASTTFDASVNRVYAWVK